MKIIDGSEIQATVNNDNWLRAFAQTSPGVWADVNTHFYNQTSIKTKNQVKDRVREEIKENT